MSIRTLFRSRTPQMIRTTDVHAKSLLPDITVETPIPEPTFLPGSRDVNIILMVKEQVPNRLKEIEKELAEMKVRGEKLEAEARVLVRLSKAVEVD